MALALDGGRAFPAFAVLDRFFSGAIHAVDDRFERDRRDWRGGLVDGVGGRGGNASPGEGSSSSCGGCWGALRRAGSCLSWLFILVSPISGRAA